jgi:hypothetical protein
MPQSILRNQVKAFLTPTIMLIMIDQTTHEEHGRVCAGCTEI